MRMCWSTCSGWGPAGRPPRGPAGLAVAHPGRQCAGRGAGHETAVPLSCLRYAQRPGEPLVVADATADDRFARDPHLAGADCCSMLVLPILSRGTLRAVLLLENRLLKAAFSADRLDAVRLIAGQLAVSVDNAQLYDELTASRARIVTAPDQTRRRIERDLHDGAQQHLVDLALRARTAQALAPPDANELLAQLDDLAAEATSAVDEQREPARGHPSRDPPQRRTGPQAQLAGPPLPGPGPVGPVDSLAATREDRDSRLLPGRRGPAQHRQTRPRNEGRGHGRHNRGRLWHRAARLRSRRRPRRNRPHPWKGPDRTHRPGRGTWRSARPEKFPWRGHDSAR